MFWRHSCKFRIEMENNFHFLFTGKKPLFSLKCLILSESSYPFCTYAKASAGKGYKESLSVPGAAEESRALVGHAEVTGRRCACCR